MNPAREGLQQNLDHKMDRAQMSALNAREQQMLQRLCEKLREGELRTSDAAIEVRDRAACIHRVFQIRC